MIMAFSHSQRDSVIKCWIKKLGWISSPSGLEAHYRPIYNIRPALFASRQHCYYSISNHHLSPAQSSCPRLNIGSSAELKKRKREIYRCKLIHFFPSPAATFLHVLESHCELQLISLCTTLGFESFCTVENPVTKYGFISECCNLSSPVKPRKTGSWEWQGERRRKRLRSPALHLY